MQCSFDLWSVGLPISSVVIVFQRGLPISRVTPGVINGPGLGVSQWVAEIAPDRTRVDLDTLLATIRCPSGSPLCVTEEVPFCSSRPHESLPRSPNGEAGWSAICGPILGRAYADPKRNTGLHISYTYSQIGWNSYSHNFDHAIENLQNNVISNNENYDNEIIMIAIIIIIVIITILVPIMIMIIIIITIMLIKVMTMIIMRTKIIMIVTRKWYQW